MMNEYRRVRRDYGREKGEMRWTVGKREGARMSEGRLRRERGQKE